MGDPERELKQNLRRLDTVLRKFDIATKGLGITAHGLRHEALIDEFVAQTGEQPALRGGRRRVDGGAGGCRAVGGEPPGGASEKARLGCLSRGGDVSKEGEGSRPIQARPAVRGRPVAQQ
jgi:hypothetical protein